MERYTNENEAYATLLTRNLKLIAYRLREIPAQHWDAPITPSAPTPASLAKHVYQWLFCDRQHIQHVDARQHQRPDEDLVEQEGLCKAIEQEADLWKDLILGLTAEQMLEERAQFNVPEHCFNTRGFIIHMIRSTLYKHGQLMGIYYALGLDGADSYVPPFPGPYYDKLPAPTG